MSAISYVDGRTSLSAEFMEMFVIKVCAEVYFMHMAVAYINCLPCYRAETVVMAFLAFVKFHASIKR